MAPKTTITTLVATILVATILVATILVALAVLATPSAWAQQGVCFHKVRHIVCHFPDGKTVGYETDAAAEFYNIQPYMTFRTADGSLHSIIGNCEISCRP